MLNCMSHSLNVIKFSRGDHHFICVNFQKINLPFARHQLLECWVHFAKQSCIAMGHCCVLNYTHENRTEKQTTQVQAHWIYNVNEILVFCNLLIRTLLSHGFS